MGCSGSKAANENKVHPDANSKKEGTNKPDNNEDHASVSENDPKERAKADSASTSHSSSFFFIDPNIPDHQGQLVESTEGEKEMILPVFILKLFNNIYRLDHTK